MNYNYEDPDTKVDRIFSEYKSKSDESRSASKVLKEEELYQYKKDQFVKKVINMIDILDTDGFVEEINEKTIEYAYLYEYDNLPLLDYIFKKQKSTRNIAEKSLIISMGYYLSTFMDDEYTRSFFEMIGYSKTEFEGIKFVL